MSPLWGSVFKFDHNPGVSPPATKMLPLWGSFFVHNYMFREAIYSQSNKLRRSGIFVATRMVNGFKLQRSDIFYNLTRISAACSNVSSDLAKQNLNCRRSRPPSNT